MKSPRRDIVIPSLLCVCCVLCLCCRVNGDVKYLSAALPSGDVFAPNRNVLVTVKGERSNIILYNEMTEAINVTISGVSNAIQLEANSNSGWLLSFVDNSVEIAATQNGKTICSQSNTKIGAYTLWWTYKCISASSSSLDAYPMTMRSKYIENNPQGGLLGVSAPYVWPVITNSSEITLESPILDSYPDWDPGEYAYVFPEFQASATEWTPLTNVSPNTTFVQSEYVINCVVFPQVLAPGSEILVSGEFSSSKSFNMWYYNASLSNACVVPDGGEIMQIWTVPNSTASSNHYTLLYFAVPDTDSLYRAGVRELCVDFIVSWRLQWNLTIESQQLPLLNASRRYASLPYAIAPPSPTPTPHSLRSDDNDNEVGWIVFFSMLLFFSMCLLMMILAMVGAWCYASRRKRQQYSEIVSPSMHTEAGSDLRSEAYRGGNSYMEVGNEGLEGSSKETCEAQHDLAREDESYQ